MDKDEWSKEDYYSFELSYEKFEEDIEALAGMVGENYIDLWQPHNQFWDYENSILPKELQRTMSHLTHCLTMLYCQIADK